MELNAGLRGSITAALAQAGLLPQGFDLDALLADGGQLDLKGKDEAGNWRYAPKEIGTELLDLAQVLSGKGSGRAYMVVEHHRRHHQTIGGEWISEDVYEACRDNGVQFTGVTEMRLLDAEGRWNVITNAGRQFLHKQGYDTTGLGSNGLNWIALSNDTLTETASSTTLSTEIAANGLTRAQGTVTLPTGSGNQTTVVKVFTATGTQSAQKAALFTASSSGTMNHALSFTQRNLINTDTLTVTFTITLG
jgi:hypothetical protein